MLMLPFTVMLILLLVLNVYDGIDVDVYVAVVIGVCGDVAVYVGVAVDVDMYVGVGVVVAVGVACLRV